MYLGETSRSTYVQGKEHLSAMDNPRLYKTINAFAKHILEEHGGSKPGFDVQVIKKRIGNYFFREGIGQRF